MLLLEDELAFVDCSHEQYIRENGANNTTDLCRRLNPFSIKSNGVACSSSSLSNCCEPHNIAKYFFDILDKILQLLRNIMTCRPENSEWSF